MLECRKAFNSFEFLSQFELQGLIIKRKMDKPKMIEMDEEMEEWGTETVEGPKIKGVE